MIRHSLMSAVSAMFVAYIFNRKKMAEKSSPTTVTVTAVVQLPAAKVWEYWTEARHIEQWNQASDDWHTPKAINDLRPGGRFVFTMAARDGSVSFDFEGTYDEVMVHEKIVYTIIDGRKVQIQLASSGSATTVTETFETENVHPVELQRQGWQAILDNFKRYAENQK